MNYEDYLRSDHWRVTRKKRMDLDGQRCVVCGSGENLNVHHLRYDHLGHEDIDQDIVTLCHRCHTTLHRIKLQTKDAADALAWCEEELRTSKENDLRREIRKLTTIEIWLRDIGSGGDLKIFDCGMAMPGKLLRILSMIYPWLRIGEVSGAIKDDLVMMRHGKICEMYQAGRSLNQIAGALGMKAANVQTVLKYHGMNHRARIR